MRKFYDLNKSGDLPQEFIDYLLIKNLYHCTPLELSKQPSDVIDMHLDFMQIESEQELINQKRAEQKARNS